MSWQAELDELARRKSFAERMGGAEKVKRHQHDGGRLTVLAEPFRTQGRAGLGMRP